MTPEALAEMPLDALLELARAREVLLVLNYGGGTNSTAMLVELVERGVPLPVILCADTGAERPEFYTFISDHLNPWLKTRGYVPVFLRRWRRKVLSKLGYHPGEFVPLDRWCEDNSTLPSAAFGFAGCSTKWKAQPLDEALAELIEPFEAAGIPVVRLFGFDADEEYRLKPRDPAGRVCRAPLVDWDWGREECRDRIASAGLPLPGKSSCYMCPHMTGPEIGRLHRDHPELFTRAVQMEEAWLREGRREPTLAEIVEDGVRTSQGAESTLAENSVMGLGRSKAWRDYSLEELEALAAQDEDDNRRPCGCVDG